MPDSPPGDWSEYQRLVLSELTRQSDNNRALDEQMRAFSVQQQLLVLQVAALTSQIATANDKLAKFEAGQLTDDAVQKYRRWLISGAVVVVTSIIIPVIGLLLGAFG